MNYEPNLTKWMKDSVVIHDADAKEPKMLMRVTGFTRDGQVKTKYIDRSLPRREYQNPMDVLHDPARFGLPVLFSVMSERHRQLAQTEWERVRTWNNNHLVGSRVKTTSADGNFETVTIGKAYYGNDCCAWVTLERGGNWALRFVEAIR